MGDGAGGRFMQSIKTFLPNTSFDSTEVFGRRYAIDDLVVVILRKIKAKCELSVQEKTIINFKERDLCISEEIGKVEFETINGKNIQQIADCINEVVAQSGLVPAQMNTVFLTGGTSRIPRIPALFAERFGRDKLNNRDAFTSVVHGLGSSVPLFVGSGAQQ